MSETRKLERKGAGIPSPRNRAEFTNLEACRERFAKTVERGGQTLRTTMRDERTTQTR